MGLYAGHVKHPPAKSQNHCTVNKCLEFCCTTVGDVEGAWFCSFCLLPGNQRKDGD